VFAVEDYLTECLDSILVHSVPDLEVIAVDDCSPDRCADILDEYAARDPRLQVVHLERNQGLGAARNIGLNQATGDYVWFVDSDDRLPLEALPAVLEKLGRDRPDVLVTGFVRTYPGERIEQDVNQPRLLRAAPAGVFGLGDYPALLDTIMTAWNKVVRRDFLLSLGMRFGSGYYEDIAVTYPLLLTGRLSVLEQVCYLYRKGRPGAILQEASPRHFDLYTEYERIFGFLDKHPEIPDSLVAAVFVRTVRQAATMHATSGLIPAGRRKEFFDQLTGYFNAYRPASYSPPHGRRGIQYRMLAQGRYLPYTMLLGANLARLLAGRVLRTTRRVVRRSGGALRVPDIVDPEQDPGDSK
jgi:CDP-glycerol glycerophosphotransferase